MHPKAVYHTETARNLPHTKPQFLVLFVCCVVWQLLILPAVYAEERDRHTLIAANAELNASFANQPSIKLEGQISLAIATAELKNSPMTVWAEQLNMTLFSVPQKALSHLETERSHTSLGFVLNEKQPLVYDPEQKRITGEITGLIDYALQNELHGATTPHEQHFILPPPRQEASIQIELILDQAIELSDNYLKPSKLEAEALLWLTAYQSKQKGYDSFHMEISTTRFTAEVASGYNLEFSRSLCLQPVRIDGMTIKTKEDENGYLTHPYYYRYLEPSGIGLEFGMPAAREQWGKVDIEFRVQDWITVKNDAYILADPNELYEIINLVHVPDCVEVFFAHRFTYPEFQGGGWSGPAGTSNGYIMTSDDNADGINFNHLAHELGHIMGLLHPGPRQPEEIGLAQKESSPGTLMCPSGIHRDNPDKNSQHNGVSLSHPLFKVSFKPISKGPDCQHNDCGQCLPF